MFDGKVPHWYHFSCFWKVGHSIRQPDVEVDGFSELRWDDQQKVKKTAEAGGVAGVWPGDQALSLYLLSCFCGSSSGRVDSCVRFGVLSSR